MEKGCGSMLTGNHQHNHMTRLPGHEAEEGVGGAEALKRHAMGRITDRSDGRGQRYHLRFVMIVIRTLN
eukprot:COSAG01_NODE_12476_length_1732_cov_5.042866_2_plen_69_part_00